MDGFFSMGLYPDWGFISTRAVKRFENRFIFWWSDIVGRWRYLLNFIWGGTSFLFVIFSLYRLLSAYRFRQP